MAKKQKPKGVTFTFTDEEYAALRSSASQTSKDVFAAFLAARKKTPVNPQEVGFYENRCRFWEAFLDKLNAPYDARMLADTSQDGGWINEEETEDES